MSERKDQELTIITKARDLVDETMSRTKKFDKRLRFTLSNRIDEKALDVLEAIVEANEINPAIETDARRWAASGASPLWAKTTKEYVNGETCTTRI